MPTQRAGKIHLLAIIPPAQDSIIPHDEWISTTIAPGKAATRYGRQWLIGKTVREGDVMSGRIGYRGSEGLAEVWDETEQDFRPVAVPQGQAVPFAIDLSRLRLAVQTRGSTIKLASLIGAFQQLLSLEGTYRWAVRSPRRLLTFSDWRATVDRVTAVRLKVKKPNPHYRDTPNLEALLEQSESEVATLELRSEQGVNTDSSFIAESQIHIEAGYGEAVYRGVSDGHETVFNTALGAEERSEDAEVNEDGEVRLDALTGLLEREAATMETEGDDGED